MAKQTINIGSAANDETGDPLRTAMDKINDNFDEIYGVYQATGTISSGNTTTNTSISNTAGLFSGNVSVTTVANSTIIRIANSTSSVNVTSGTVLVGSNVALNTSAIFIGNSTVNNSLNSSLIRVANSTASANLTRVALTVGISSVNSIAIAVGNTTVNTTVNSSFITVRGANVVTNTFNLGSFVNGANGYVYLPNGLKMNWGWVSANNSTGGNATFTAAYTTNAYVVTATSNSAVATYQAAVIGTNNTVAQIRTSNAASTNVFWTAIGS
jgi:hypothetical protein